MSRCREGGLRWWDGGYVGWAELSNDWHTPGVVFGWTLGWCVYGLRCPVKPLSLVGGRSFAQDLFRLGLSSRTALCGTRSFGEPLCTTVLFSRAGGGDGEERREEGMSRRARGSPCAAHVVRCFSESAARKAAPRPIKLGTSFSNFLCPRPLADGLVPVDTRGPGATS